MSGSETTTYRIFSDSSDLAPLVSPGSPGPYECSDQPNCERGTNCTGQHTYSFPSYMTPKWFYIKFSVKKMALEEQEVDQIPKGGNLGAEEKQEEDRGGDLGEAGHEEHKSGGYGEKEAGESDLGNEEEQREGEDDSDEEGECYVADSMDGDISSGNSGS